MPTECELFRYYRDGYDDWYFAQERLAFEPEWVIVKDLVENEGSPHNVQRRQYYDEAFPARSDFTGAVVDFGGNDGGWTARLFPNARSITVIDLGFEGDKESALRNCDLLFAAHVLEHVANPYRTLEQLKTALKPTAKVWIEVPQQYEGSLADRFRDLERADNGLSPLPNMHEHIQHFSVESVQKLLRRCGLQTERATQHPGSFIGMLGAFS